MSSRWQKQIPAICWICNIIRRNFIVPPLLEKMMNKKDLIKAFSEIPTGAVSDAIDYLKISSGVIIDAPKPMNLNPDDAKMVGLACTIQQMPKRQINPGKVKQLDVYNSIAQPGEVVVIDAGGRMDCATTGGLQVTRAAYRGLAGVILNGCCRDADDIKKGHFPFFSLGSCPRKSVPLETTGINVPITIKNVQICPGDLIVADSTGIVVVPIEVAEEVLERARFVVRVEEEMEKRLKAGEDYSGLRDRVTAELTV